MKTNVSGRKSLFFICMLLFGADALAQETNQVRSAGDLETLLAPVALYPDALIAVMLPAATVPADVVLAARYLAAGGATNQLDEQAWDDSVRTLARYPELIQWMNENLEWTRAAGEAFRVQPAEVLAAVQRLRAKAQAAGNLVSTPQQRVVTTQNIITIVPAEPEIIYVPTYDPVLVYATPAPWNCSWISFGLWWRLGTWHHYDFDWRHCSVRRYEHHPHERYPFSAVRPWHPPPVAERPSMARPAPVPRPQPLMIAAKPATSVPVAVTIPSKPTREVRQHEEREMKPRDIAWRSTTPRTPAPTPPAPRITMAKPSEIRTPPPPAVTSIKPVTSPAQPVQMRPPTTIKPTPEKNIFTVRSSAPATPQPQPREITVRTPTPAPERVVRRETPRPETKISPPPASIVRTTAPTPPTATPRVQVSPPMPSATPVTRTVLTPVTAPQNLRIELRTAPTVPQAPRGVPVQGMTAPGTPIGNGERPGDGRRSSLAARGP